MDRELMRRRLGEARVGHLATADAGGIPHLVPVCFALEDESIHWTVDFKPKSGPDLKRLRNLAENPRAALLVHHYEEDWTRLWWIRVDLCEAAVVDGAARGRGLDLLAAKYEQYRLRRPAGPVVQMSIEHWSGWAAGPSGERD